MRRLFKVLLFNFTSVLVVLILLELAFRLYNAMQDKPSYIADDSTFGWVAAVGFPGEITTNRCGEKVVMASITDSLIRKTPFYPDAATTVLFIGDSYTHAHEVSSGVAYYDVFDRMGAGKYRVFAAAVGGFGSLQEYMILQKVYNNIKPDIVVWQMCSNDVSNNVYELDNSSFFNNQRARPYLNLSTGEVEMKNPGFFLFEISDGFNYVFSRILAFDREYKWGFLQFLNGSIALSSKERKTFVKKGFTVVDTLLQKMKREHPHVKFIGFSVNKRYDSEFNSLFKKAHFSYWSGFAEYMDGYDKMNCAPLDAHWNHYGNRVAGEHIFSLLQEE